jgi:membrane fusion protein, heavy metal efflux system
MIGRWSLTIVALVVGFALASFLPEWPHRMRAAISSLSGSVPAVLHAQEPASPVRKPGSDATEDQQGVVKLSEDEIRTAGIEVSSAQAGTIGHRIVLPGAIIPHADRIAHVAVKLSGTVAELHKKIGDLVEKNELLAVLESRELADAKSEFLAARLTNELQQDLFEREKLLWEKKIESEQQFLRSRNAAAQAKMRNDIARQKLFALGLTEAAIAGVPSEPETSLRRQEVHSPMSGHVVERKVELGMAMGRDNLETELFVISDLDRVWVEIAMSPADLPLIKEGQTVSVTARGIREKAEGKIVFVSPLLDKESRSGRVVAEIANGSGVWRPGSFVTAAIAFEEQPVSLVVPTGAIQTMGPATIVFVRTPDGFQKRQVFLGQSDDRNVEVKSGLRPGEEVATSNSFLLKAELMKALAED